MDASDLKDARWESIYAAVFARLFVDTLEVRADHLVQDHIEECIFKAAAIADYEQEMQKALMRNAHDRDENR